MYQKRKPTVDEHLYVERHRRTQDTTRDEVPRRWNRTIYHEKARERTGERCYKAKKLDHDMMMSHDKMT